METICYVCGVQLPPHTPEWEGDNGTDEDGHRVCDPCFAEITDIYRVTAEWRSSEDRKLWVDNAAAEGLRRGKNVQHDATARTRNEDDL